MASKRKKGKGRKPGQAPAADRPADRGEHDSTPPVEGADHWSARGRFLLATVFLTGGSVMVLELLGTRVMAPVFGLSIYVWTAVISVTLLALASGYQVGGNLADRFHEGPFLYRSIGFVAFWTAGLTWMGVPVVDSMSDMGPRWGPLVCCAVLFFPPLFLLAMVGPFVVRLLTREVHHVGSIVGRVTALSTVGSVVGTILTGFVLIPEVGVERTLLGVAVLLLGLSVVGLVLVGRGAMAMAAAGIVFVLPGLLPYLEPGDRYPIEIAAGGNLEVTLLAERSSPYAELKIADVVLPGPNPGDPPIVSMRWMFIGQAPQSMQFVVQPPYRMPYYVDSIHLVEGFHRRPRRYLVIGMGGGSLTQVLRAKEGVERIDVVEIDPVVVELAREHFGFAEGGPVDLHVVDGRDFVRRTAEAGSYDVIFFDAFGAGTAPFHLFTVESLREMRRVLAEDGLFVMNYLGFNDAGRREAIDSVLRTVQEVFEEGRVVLGERPDDDPANGGFANYLILAADRPIELVRHPFEYLPAGSEARRMVARYIDIHRAFRDEHGLPAIEGLPEIDFDRLIGSPADEGQRAWADLDDRLSRIGRGSLDRLLDVTAIFDPASGRLVTDDLNGLEVANAAQNEALRRVVFKNFRAVFVGR